MRPTIWRKMSSAPKDGTRILVVEAPGGPYDYALVSWDGDTGAWREANGDKIDPIYWTDIPIVPYVKMNA